MELPSLSLGREVTGWIDAATRREWLVTDGTGSFAMGTVAGARTRRYHGLLVAALRPPLGRTLVLGGLLETVTLPGNHVRFLHTQRWASGIVDPRGHELCEEFRLDGGLPVWRIALDGGAVIERRLWMPRGSSTTVISYALLDDPGGGGAALSVSPLCAWRDYHGTAHAGDPPQVVAEPDGVVVRWPQGGIRLRSGSECQTHTRGDWYRGFLLDEEWERGLEAVEDLFAGGGIDVRLTVGATVLITAGLADAPALSAAESSLEVERGRRAAVLRRAAVDGEPDWVRQLVLAADDVIARRDGGETVMAGYPWFGDWGRDTMIGLPGLAIETGRPEIAAGLLRTFAGHVSQGLVPNRFPDDGAAPEYNTIDATLWYIEALRAYVESTGDEDLVDELWPTLEEIIRWHVAGTYHGIGMDPADGLLRGGEPGIQLTWMDAKVSDWVVTPRIGKPVEVNALWFNALQSLAVWAATRSSRHDHRELADRARQGFDRYWDPTRGYLRDVLDGPQGDDCRLRPNQLFAVSLVHSPLDASRAGAVVAACMTALRTSMGVRTLAPGSPDYVTHYTGGVRERDGGYHQGTVWPWLLGSLVQAHLRVHGDPVAARALLAPMAHHVADAGLGSVSEIADADPPHAPRGCPFQAWSVAEVLRAWRLCRRAERTSGGLI